MEMLRLLVETPALAVQILADGVLIGAIFALAAYGMALVWGVMNIINVCQGELVVLGGYIGYTLWAAGWSPILGPPVAALALFVLGWALYRLVIFRVVDRDIFISLLATYGLAILTSQLINQVWGADVLSTDVGLGNWFFFDGLVSIAKIRVVAAGVTVFLGIGLVLFMRRTRLGQAIRATAQNPRAARILGVDTHAIYAFTYGLNAAICGAAGALIAMIWVIQPFGGLIYTVRAFMVVVIAGVGNLAGVVAAALGLGIFEQLVGFLLGAQFQISLVFVLLVVVLVARGLRLARARRALQ